MQISPLWDVSEKLHETSQRCVWDTPMPAGKCNQPFKFGQLIVYKTKNIFLEKSWYYWWRNLFQKNQKPFLKKSKLSVSLNQKSKVLCSLFLLYVQVNGYRALLNLGCRSLAFNSYKAFLKIERALASYSAWFW